MYACSIGISLQSRTCVQPRITKIQHFQQYCPVGCHVENGGTCSDAQLPVMMNLTGLEGGFAYFVANNEKPIRTTADRDIDLYHWSSERFSAAWKTTISVLVAKGRARVGVAASVADWPKRIRDLQFLDHEGYAAAT